MSHTGIIFYLHVCVGEKRDRQAGLVQRKTCCVCLAVCHSYGESEALVKRKRDRHRERERKVKVQRRKCGGVSFEGLRLSKP